MKAFRFILYILALLLIAVGVLFLFHFTIGMVFLVPGVFLLLTIGLYNLRQAIRNGIYNVER